MEFLVDGTQILALMLLELLHSGIIVRLLLHAINDGCAFAELGVLGTAGDAPVIHEYIY